MVGAVLKSKGNLRRRLVLSGHKMRPSLHPSAKPYKLMQRPETRFGQVYPVGVLNLKAMSMEQPLGEPGASRTPFPRTGKGGEEPRLSSGSSRVTWRSCLFHDLSQQGINRMVSIPAQVHRALHCPTHNYEEAPGRYFKGPAFEMQVSKTGWHF